jgi:hypothetical protein
MATDGSDVRRKCWSCKISRFPTHEKARNLMQNLFRAVAGHCLSRLETQAADGHPLTQTGFLAYPKVVLHSLPWSQTVRQCASAKRPIQIRERPARRTPGRASWLDIPFTSIAPGPCLEMARKIDPLWKTIYYIGGLSERNG